MARTLKLEVVAEGVETDAQLTLLRTHGCQTMQGYLFSKPVPDAVFRTLRRQFVAPAAPSTTPFVSAAPPMPGASEGMNCRGPNRHARKLNKLSLARRAKVS